MLKLLKWLFILAFIGFVGTALWTSFALWSGKYSVYSSPPSKEDPEGFTLVVERDGNEPMFNSPHYVPPGSEADGGKEGIRFGKLKFLKKKPFEIRTVFTLPFVDLAYEQSLNEKQLEIYRKSKEKNRMK